MRNMTITHIFEIHYDLKEKKRPVWDSAGGFHKRFRQPAALPPADL
jgi:hypothetical protein